MIRLYTDGACRDVDGCVPIVSWAYAVIHDTLPEDRQCTSDCYGECLYYYTNSRNVAGEIEAVCRGLHYLVGVGVRKATIFYDYEGIEKWITGEWQAKIELTKEYVQEFKRICDFGDIDIGKKK